MQLIAQPLHHRAADEDAAFERELLFAHLGAGGRDQAVLRLHDLIAGMQQHEAAGAVGVLRHAGLVAGLAEERRLLVAGDAADDQRLAEHARRQYAEGMGRRMHVGQHGARHAQQLQQLRIPIVGVDVEEHGARSVRRIGHVRAIAGELPDEPGIHGAEGELAALGAPARARNLIQQPRELGAAEVGIDDQAGALGYQALGADLLQLVAHRRGAPVLPDDRVMERLAGLAVPQQRGLALVGDADRHHVV